MYQVIKHSAKGTTWGDHKYIRKEGNRYIYPEDVKKSASNNTSDNSDIDDYLKSLPESSFKTNYEKGISMDQISKNDFDTLYKNDPEFRKLVDEVNAKREKEENLVKAEVKKETDKFNEDTLPKTDPRFKYTIKRNSDPADKYKVVRDKNDEHRELAKSRANISDEVSRKIHGNDEKSNKYYKDRRRAISIEAYKDTIKEKKDASLNNLKRGEELARKRRDMRQRNRYVSYYNVGPLRIRQDASVAGRSKTVTGDPDTKIKVVKKKKRR